MAVRNLKYLITDVKVATAEAAQKACVNIMNSLAKRGPAWTGKFSSAWYAVPKGGSMGGPRGEGSIYSYELSDVPVTDLHNGVLYTIQNSMSYADQALDFTSFDPTTPLPPKTVKSKITYGTRPPSGARGELNNVNRDRSNRRTAPLDWYPTYVSGGGLQKDLRFSVSNAFKVFTPKGFGK
jgi:hypothetical protein